MLSCYSATFQPFAQRTQQYVKEQLGQSNEKVYALNDSSGRSMLTKSQTQLPPDYLELEQRVDALKQVHTKLLAVT